MFPIFWGILGAGLFVRRGGKQDTTQKKEKQTPPYPVSVSFLSCFLSLSSFLSLFHFVILILLPFFVWLLGFA